MTRNIHVAAMAVLALSGLALSQPIVKTGPCPNLTRYTPPENWTTFPIEPSPTTSYPVGTVQNPLTPQESINCTQVPEGLRAQIVASELTPGINSTVRLAYLMHYTFDERGRVWAVDSRDYPYTHDSTGTSFANPPTGPARLTNGRSRIVILEDTNGDGALDNFKVFYTGLVMPTSIEVVKNGVIATVPPYVAYLQRHPGNPDTALGTPDSVVRNMGSATANFDSHGQTNSLTRGLDNFIYGHQGYNGSSSAIVGTNPGVSFGSGNIWRFKATTIGSDTNIFQVHSNNGPSNAHGIGQMEDGQWFKSAATCNPRSHHQVRHGVGAQNLITGTTSCGSGGNTANMGDANVFYPLTRDLYLWEGSTTDLRAAGYATGTSAVTGHDFYTARLLPQKYWNRFSFMCEGASKLCNQDSLVLNGSSWSLVRMPGPQRSNIFASSDAWTAPLKVRTGPEGGLWVNDWYNYLFLHNPASPSTNAAWRNVLRAKSRTRLYRIIPESGVTDPVLNLTNANEAQLVATFWNTNFLWRLHAQRLLIERGYTSTLGDLLDSVISKHRTVDAVGIDGPVLHALWTLHGLKRLDIDSTRWNPKLRDLLLHPAWTVRRNVALAMPGTAASYESIRATCAVNDEHAHVRVQALQNLTRMPASGALIESLDGLRSDNHITSAYTAAGGSKVVSVTGSTRPGTCPAYLATSDALAGWPSSVASVAGSQDLRAHRDIRFNLGVKGFTLGASANLASGELVVTDLRGRIAFRSTYNAATRTWSQGAAKGLSHPFYFYTFRAVNGSSFNGRIAMNQGI